MITKIEVDGFKSLSDFKLYLNSGLNILVGPNGSGKTNIVLFFEFLSKLTTNQVGNAVSSVGGAGAIFKKIGSNEYEPNIEFKIYGSKNIAKNKAITYEYSATITTSFEKDSIYYSKQNIRYRSGTKYWASPDEKGYFPNKWDFILNSETNETGSTAIEIEKINTKKIKPRFFDPKEGTKSLEENITDLVKNFNPSFRNLIGCLFPFIDELVFNIHSDLVGGETFNVVPSKVKEIEDAATPPGIKKDGSGLATTLYAMKQSKSKKGDLPDFFYFLDRQQKKYDPETLKKIVGYLKLANKTIKDLDVVNDPFDNKLIVKIFIETGSYDSVLPLSAMSDGTIKWLALITAILTSKTIFSIEEPENFLHPWMQAEIANIMRNHISEKKEHSFVIMTTHSESLLNHSEANEIVLVDLENGKTIAKRIENIELVKEEISNSGFGLGHFYFSDSL
jgi:predicted ATPase